MTPKREGKNTYYTDRKKYFIQRSTIIEKLLMIGRVTSTYYL